MEAQPYTKAFDKLWRDVLFYKLKYKIEPCLWRVIISYYKNSQIIVKIGSEKSEAYKLQKVSKKEGYSLPTSSTYLLVR